MAKPPGKPAAAGGNANQGSAMRLSPLFCTLLILAAPAWGAEKLVGKVTHLSGTLVVARGGAAPLLLAVKSDVREGDVLSTQQESYARLRFVDGAEVVLRPNSRLAVSEYRFQEEAPAEDKSSLALLKGGLRSVTGAVGKRNPERVEVKTPVASIGIRGTHFGTLLCAEDCDSIPTPSGSPLADGLYVDVADGTINVSNSTGSQLLGAGQFGFVANFASPPVIVPPMHGVQVTMPQGISRNNNRSAAPAPAADSADCKP